MLSGHFWIYYLNTGSIFCVFGVPEFLQRNAVPQPAARVTGTKQLYPKPSRVRLVSQLVQHTHTHIHLHKNIVSHLINTKHSHKYECTHLLVVSNTHSLPYTNTMLSTIYRGTFGTFSVSQKPNKVQAQSHLELSYNQTKKPRTHRKLPHQPTKQREYVRMIIMTDNKKETNQKPKSLK